MKQYENTGFVWDSDNIFDKAMKNGWVRIIYEKDLNPFKGEVSINRYDKERVRYVLKNVFFGFNLIRNEVICIEYEQPKESPAISTFNGKDRLIDFLN